MSDISETSNRLSQLRFLEVRGRAGLCGGSQCHAKVAKASSMLSMSLKSGVVKRNSRHSTTAEVDKQAKRQGDGKDTIGPLVAGGGGVPEGTKRVTSVNVQLPCLQKDLRTGSISRDIVNFPSELCMRRGRIFTDVARLVPPGHTNISGPNRGIGRTYLRAAAAQSSSWPETTAPPCFLSSASSCNAA